MATKVIKAPDGTYREVPEGQENNWYNYKAVPAPSGSGKSDADIAASMLGSSPTGAKRAAPSELAGLMSRAQNAPASPAPPLPSPGASPLPAIKPVAVPMFNGQPDPRPVNPGPAGGLGGAAAYARALTAWRQRHPEEQ